MNVASLEPVGKRAHTDPSLGLQSSKHVQPVLKRWIKKNRARDQEHANASMRRKVYDCMPAVAIDGKSSILGYVRQTADLVFDKIQQERHITTYKLNAKREFCYRVVEALLKAVCIGGCVMYSRRLSKGSSTRAGLQVVDAMVAAGFAEEVRSKPGSPKVSRLVPSPLLHHTGLVDPWEVERDCSQRLVFLRGRETKEELSFDPRSPVPLYVERRLKMTNRVNSQYEITYRYFDPWKDALVGSRRLRPIHYAVFTNSFDLHGRIYTGKYGHQLLRRIERQTITFNGEPSVELDYAGLHCRLLYHLERIEYRRDPYALWGRNTDEPRRLLAKVFVNALINADRPDVAIAACNGQMRMRTRTGGFKTGQSLEDALRLLRATRMSGLRFKELLPSVLKYHRPISHHFGQDMGMQLMRLDGKIALDILTHFAKRGKPCLGRHDSFVVPRTCEAELRQVMMAIYRRYVGYWPQVKKFSV